MRKIAMVLLIVFLFLTVVPLAQSQTPGNNSVLVFVIRTKGHQKYSKVEVFDTVVKDVFAYLNEKQISLAKDEFGGRTHANDEMPVETVMNIARDANASSVLCLIVDRPVTKWVKVTLRAYDITGKQLWEEKAESGGGLSGAHGLRVTLDRLRSALDKHVGNEGLPVLAAAAGTTGTKP